MKWVVAAGFALSVALLGPRIALAAGTDDDENGWGFGDAIALESGFCTEGLCSHIVANESPTAVSDIILPMRLSVSGARYVWSPRRSVRTELRIDLLGERSIVHFIDHGSSDGHIWGVGGRMSVERSWLNLNKVLASYVLALEGWGSWVPTVMSESEASFNLSDPVLRAVGRGSIGVRIGFYNVFVLPRVSYGRVLHLDYGSASEIIEWGISIGLHPVAMLSRSMSSR